MESFVMKLQMSSIGNSLINLSIRWVSNDYEISEDPIGLSDTKANTITNALKDILIRCCLPISLCRGQAYDGATNMQGRKGHIQREVPAAVPVHCLLHSVKML